MFSDEWPLTHGYAAAKLYGGKNLAKIQFGGLMRDIPFGPETNSLFQFLFSSYPSWLLLSSLFIMGFIHIMSSGNTIYTWVCKISSAMEGSRECTATFLNGRHEQ